MPEEREARCETDEVVTRHQIARKSTQYNRPGLKVAKVKMLKTMPFTAADGSETKKKNRQKRGS